MRPSGYIVISGIPRRVLCGSSRSEGFVGRAPGSGSFGSWGSLFLPWIGLMGTRCSAPTAMTRVGLVLLSDEEACSSGSSVVSGIVAGIQAATHAIGDAALIRSTLRAIAAIRAATLGSRKAIEHAQILHLDDFEALARAGVVVSKPVHGGLRYALG